MIFSVWYLDQQQQPLGTCLEMSLSGLIPDLLNQKLWRRGPTVWISTSLPKGSNICSRVRPSMLLYLRAIRPIEI